jgi:hypothetical protein
MTVRRIILWVFLMLAGSGFLHAQKLGKYWFKRNLKKSFNNWRLNVNYGPTLFYGDLSYNEFKPFNREITDYKLALSVTTWKVFHPAFSWHTRFLKGNLASTQVFQLDTAMTKHIFDSKLFTVSTGFKISISNIVKPRVLDRRFNLYAVCSMGMVHYKSHKYNLFSGANYGRKSEWTFSVPFILGTDWRINEKLSLNLESCFYKTFSDNIDVTVGGKAKDAFQHTSIGLIIVLANKK